MRKLCLFMLGPLGRGSSTRRICGPYSSRKNSWMSIFYLTDEDIGKFNRDLRMLIATNGTRARVLEVASNDEIVLQLIKQQIHRSSTKIPEFKGSAMSRVLRRQVLPSGRRNKKQGTWPFAVRSRFPYCRRAQAPTAGSRPDGPSTAVGRSSVNQQISKASTVASEYPCARKFEFDRDSECRRIAATATSRAGIS
jgi:hypothetical protein